MPSPPSSSSFLAMTAPPERTQCFSWGPLCPCATFLQAQTHLELLNISQFCFFSSLLQSPSVGTGLGGVAARLGGAVLWGSVGRGWCGVCESLQCWGQQCHRGHSVQVMLQEMPPQKGQWALRDCVITVYFTRSEIWFVPTLLAWCSTRLAVLVHRQFLLLFTGIFPEGKLFFLFFSLALQNHSNWQEGSQGGTALDTILREKIIIIKRRRMKVNSLNRVFQEVLGMWSSLPLPGSSS